MNLYYFIWKSISLKMQACTHTNPHHLWYNEGGSKLPDIKTNPGQRYWSGKSRHPLRQECKTCPSQCPIISPYHQIHRQGIGKLSHSLDWKMHWCRLNPNKSDICGTGAHQQENRQWWTGKQNSRRRPCHLWHTLYNHPARWQQV